MADLTLTLNDQEQAALRQMIDVALRHSGAGALDVAAHFAAKLRVAEARAEQEQAAPVPAPQSIAAADAA